MSLMRERPGGRSSRPAWPRPRIPPIAIVFVLILGVEPFAGGRRGAVARFLAGGRGRRGLAALQPRLHLCAPRHAVVAALCHDGSGLPSSPRDVAAVRPEHRSDRRRSRCWCRLATAGGRRLMRRTPWPGGRAESWSRRHRPWCSCLASPRPSNLAPRRDPESQPVRPLVRAAFNSAVVDARLLESSWPGHAAVVTLCHGLGAVISILMLPSRTAAELERAHAAGPWLWTRHPGWTNPLPEVFAEIVLHAEGTVVPTATMHARRSCSHQARARRRHLWPMPCAPAPRARRSVGPRDALLCQSRPATATMTSRRAWPRTRVHARPGPVATRGRSAGAAWFADAEWPATGRPVRATRRPARRMRRARHPPSAPTTRFVVVPRTGRAPSAALRSDCPVAMRGRAPRPVDRRDGEPRRASTALHRPVDAGDSGRSRRADPRHAPGVPHRMTHAAATRTDHDVPARPRPRGIGRPKARPRKRFGQHFLAAPGPDRSSTRSPPSPGTCSSKSGPVPAR